jgi:hypothetical protein
MKEKRLKTLTLTKLPGVGDSFPSSQLHLPIKEKFNSNMKVNVSYQVNLLLLIVMLFRIFVTNNIIIIWVLKGS